MFESFMVVAALGFINVPGDNTFKCFKVTLMHIIVSVERMPHNPK